MAPLGTQIGAKSKSASLVVDSPDAATPSVAPASIKSNGSRFHLGEVARGFARIGWQNPLQMWEQHLKLEIKSFIFPSADVHSYSEATGKVAPHLLQKELDVAMAPPYGGALLLPLSD